MFYQLSIQWCASTNKEEKESWGCVWKFIEATVFVVEKPYGELIQLNSVSPLALLYRCILKYVTQYSFLSLHIQFIFKLAHAACW